MVGSPYQTSENLISDIRFSQKLKPDMIGICMRIKYAQAKKLHNAAAVLKEG